MARKRTSIEVYLPHKKRRFDMREIEFFHDKSILLSESVLYVGSFGDNNSEESGVDYRQSEEIIKNLMVLQNIGNPINIIINNIGGDVNHGLAIYDAIKMCRVPVTVIVYGSAMSMAAVILQAGDFRYLMPNARIMIHKGEAGYHGELENLRRFTKEITELDNIVSRIIAERTGLTPQKIQKLVSHDTYLSAHKAVELGLADKVLEYPKKSVRKGINSGKKDENRKKR